MANPTLDVDVSQFATEGFVRLSWTNATKGTEWYAWRVYRRTNVPSGKWVLLKEYQNDLANYVLDDYQATSNVEQQWIVVRVHLVGFVPTEETRTPLVEDTPESDNYWLVHPFNSYFTTLLYSVKSDSFGKESEIGEMNIIGRGRRADYGSTWGRRGSLTAQVRDKIGITSRQQLVKLQDQADQHTYFWFRNPFGDMFRVVIENVHFDRLAGVGVQEYADVSFDYVEVTA